MDSLPLAGRRILVTRAAQQAGRLSNGLRELGAIAVEVPVLEIAPPLSFNTLDLALGRIGQYDWVIFTSVNTVAALKARGEEIGFAPAGLSTAKVAAVGTATAAAAREAGWNVTLIPESSWRKAWLLLSRNRMCAASASCWRVPRWRAM